VPPTIPRRAAAAAVDVPPPRWLVRPATLEAAARVVALAHDEGLAVVPRGAGSALAMGGVPRVSTSCSTSRASTRSWNTTPTTSP
jgi:FAD/FMN-containing dehydrogenase